MTGVVEEEAGNGCGVRGKTRLGLKGKEERRVAREEMEAEAAR